MTRGVADFQVSVHLTLLTTLEETIIPLARAERVSPPGDELLMYRIFLYT